MFTPIGFYEGVVGGGGSTSATYSSQSTLDVYGLEEYAYSDSVYNKSTAMNLGRYERARDTAGNIGSRLGYTAELLCKIPPATITALSGKTVDSFTISYTVSTVANLYTGTGGYVRVYECTNAWSDNGTTSPKFSTFSTTTAWQPILVTDLYQWLGATSIAATKTIQGSTDLTALLQAWINGTKTNNGLILGLTCQYWGSWLVVSNVTFNVVYH